MTKRRSFKVKASLARYGSSATGTSGTQAVLRVAALLGCVLAAAHTFEHCLYVERVFLVNCAVPTSTRVLQALEVHARVWLVPAV